MSTHTPPQPPEGASIPGLTGDPIYDDAIRQGWERARNAPPPPDPRQEDTRDLILHHTRYAHGRFWRCVGGLWQPHALPALRRELHLLLASPNDLGTDLSGFVGDFTNAGRVESMLRLLCRHLEVEPAEWDQPTPGLVPLQNGLYDLAAGRLVPHVASNHLATALPYAYDPAAQAPAWTAFLQSTVPKSAAFLQEFAGYCLTHDTHHELALCLVGPSGSGKSTFLFGLQTLLGPFCAALSLAALDRRRFALPLGSRHTLYLAAEQPTPAGENPAAFAVHRLAALISGEPLTVEPKFRAPIAVQPRAKLVAAFSRLPAWDQAFAGLFRRLCLVPFPARRSRPDPSLKARLALEGPGLFNWALAGLARLTARGRFQPPTGVRTLTAAFQAGADLPAQFVAECCRTGPNLRAAGHALYARYRAWCRANGFVPLAANQVTADWQRLGFRRTRIHGQSYWQGLAVNPGPDSDEDSRIALITSPEFIDDLVKSVTSPEIWDRLADQLRQPNPPAELVEAYGTVEGLLRAKALYTSPEGEKLVRDFAASSDYVDFTLANFPPTLDTLPGANWRAAPPANPPAGPPEPPASDAP